MPERLARGYWIRLQRVLRRIARGHGTTHEIALGAAIGIFVGMTPTIGLQMIIAAAVATLVGANRLSAVLPVWISNPATMFWIYGTNYAIGRLLVGGPELSRFLEEFNQVNEADGLFTAMGYVLDLGLSIQLPLWLGSLVLGTVFAVPTYYLTHCGIDTFRARRTRRRKARAERVTQVLLKRAEEEEDSDCDADGDDTPEPDASDLD